MKIYYLNPPIEEMKRRSMMRGNGHDKKMTEKKWNNELDRYEKLLNHPVLKDYVETRENLNINQSNKIFNANFNIFKNFL